MSGHEQGDEVGTIRREEHDENGPYPGHTIWVQMARTPTRSAPAPHFFWLAVWSTAPGNIGARTDEFGDEASWPIEDWPVIGAIPGTPAAELATFT